MTEGPTEVVTEVHARPRRLRTVCFVVAPVIVLTFVALGFGLRGTTGGGGEFELSDQLAMGGLGLLFAVAVLWLTRPSVDADGERIRVRNLGGPVVVPWREVAAVTFAPHAPWAALDLVNDERVPLMAVQSTDRWQAVATVRALRTLHAAATAGS
ncbi:MAG: PH domain-containing protein [Mycobacteriales bacterium]